MPTIRRAPKMALNKPPIYESVSSNRWNDLWMLILVEDFLKYSLTREGSVVTW